MYSDESDDDGGNIDGLWGFSPAAEKEEISEEKKKEEMLARKKSRQLLENM